MANDVTTRQSSSAFWASVREALRGSHQDYTTGSLTRAIFLLAVPMVLEMFMESLFGIVDVFWVARLVRVSLTGIVQMLIPHIAWISLMRIVSVFGNAALAGYTIAIRIVVFFILPAWGLSGAAATLVGQNLGARQPERAEQSVWKTGVYNALVMGGVGAIFIVFPGPLVRLFTHDPEIVSIAAACLRIVSIGNIGYAYEMVMVQAFNGAGDTVTPTLVNFFGFIVLEIPFAYALAIPLGMHSKGVYWAINVSESAIAVAMVLLFRRGRWKEKKI
jgi:Na+-driven multidrug efflux pump